MLVKNNKRKNGENTVLKIADLIVFHQNNNNIEETEELAKHIKIPGKMKITKENNEFIIKYKNLTYNVNIGRFLLDQMPNYTYY